MSNLWDLTHIQPERNIVLAGNTLPAIFWNAVAERGPNVWLRQKELGIWRSWSWTQTGAAVREIGDGLLSLGFAAGHCASILSNTQVDWVLTDLAVLSCGGVSSGIYPTDAASQVQYLCEDSATRVLFVEDDEQLDKVLEVRDRLPMLHKIVVFDMEGLSDLRDPMVIGLDDLRALGRTHARTHPAMLDTRVAGCRPEDLAILVYTSGTTGKPKGVMLTARRAGLLRCMGTTPSSRRPCRTNGCVSCRCAILPSASVASTTRCTRAPSSILWRTRKRCLRTSARSPPR